jgi:hypothetical protein
MIEARGPESSSVRPTPAAAAVDDTARGHAQNRRAAANRYTMQLLPHERRPPAPICCGITAPGSTFVARADDDATCGSFWPEKRLTPAAAAR